MKIKPESKRLVLGAIKDFKSRKLPLAQAVSELRDLLPSIANQNSDTILRNHVANPQLAIGILKRQKYDG